MPVGEQMHVLDKSGKPVPNVYCIGDANGEGTTAVWQTFTIVTCRLDCLQLTMMLVLLRPPRRCLGRLTRIADTDVNGMRAKEVHAKCTSTLYSNLRAGMMASPGLPWRLCHQAVSSYKCQWLLTCLRPRRQVHAGTRSERTGHQCRGKHVWPVTHPQPPQRTRSLLHAPRGKVS